MVLKLVKYSLVTAGGLAIAGGVLFGTDLLSYASSSAKTVRQAVKDTVPIEFELRRARDLLEQIIPEMHANVRLIAQEEVAVESLREDIVESRPVVAREQSRIQKIRHWLDQPQAVFTVADRSLSRQQLSDELARRFDRFKEAQVVFAGKQRLLETREKSLAAAMQMLDRTRSQKVRLEDKIESLESQYRLIQASAIGTHAQIDHSKLAQTQKLIDQIRERLDVAERVLAHEARFVEPIEIEVISEHELLAEVDDYFHPKQITEDTEELTTQLSQAE